MYRIYAMAASGRMQYDYKQTNTRYCSGSGYQPGRFSGEWIFIANVAVISI